MKEGVITDAPPIKAAILQYCGDRNDEWSREVGMRCHGVYDLAAAEAQYHLRCYDEFRKTPDNINHVVLYDDEAMKLRCMLTKSYVLGHPLNYMINI